jgi:hypothetical protein
VIDVIRIIPVNDETILLRWDDRAAPEGSINIKGGCFRTHWRIYYDRADIVECSPVTSEVFDVDLVVDGRLGRVVSREGKILNYSTICRIKGLRDSTEWGRPEWADQKL